MFVFVVGAVLHCRTISDVSHLPDLSTVLTSHRTNRNGAVSDVVLSSPEYQSNTIAIHSQTLKLSGLHDDLSKVFEGQGSVDRMFDIHNGTVELRFLELCSENLETLRLSEQSECVMAAGKIHVLEDRTPLRCDDSRLIVDSCEFVFQSEVSPSLFTTRSTSGEVCLRNCEMGDRSAATSGSFVSSSCVQDLKMEKCRFQNISHCPTYSRSDLATPFFNVSVVDSVFARSENVFSGGVVRDVNDKTTLLSLNSSFTHSLSTFTEVEDYHHIQQPPIEVTTNHRYLRCLFQLCTTSNVYGGAIRCNTGASLEIVSCRFDRNSANATSGDNPMQGGGIYFSGDKLTTEFYMAHTLHTKDHANVGGSAAILYASKLFVQYCNVSESKCTYPDMIRCWGGGYWIAYMPKGSLLSNVRFEDCSTEGSGGSLDNSQANADFTYSNLLICNSRCRQGNVVFSSITTNITICFFSCLFFNNEASETKSTNVSGQPATLSVGNDIRFHTNNEWKAILANDSSFVNSFSTSRSPRISIGSGPHIVDFSYLEISPNYTRLDVRLPDPAVLVDISKGSNGPVCGTSYSGRCETIGYAGTERLEKDDVQVIVEAGRYDETQAFSIGAKTVKVSSFGDFHPIVLFSPLNSEDAFMTNEGGSLSLSYFVFVPSRSASIVKQSGGSLSIASCVFRGEEGVEAIESNVVDVRGGTAKLEIVDFSSFTLNGGHCIACLDTTSKLEMVSCSLLWLTGDSDSAIQFARSSSGGEMVLEGVSLEWGREASEVGGVLCSNVSSISLTSVSFAHLRRSSQQAPLSIESCSTSLTHSGLLFEDCVGTAASSLFVDAASTCSLSSPLLSSLSITESPRSSVGGDTTTEHIHLPASIVVDGVNGKDESLCWASPSGCGSVSDLSARLLAEYEWSISMKSGTTSEDTLLLAGKTIKIAGKGKDLSILESSQPSSLLSMSSGTVSFEAVGFTQSSSLLSTDRTESLFVVSGGRLSLTSVDVSGFSFALRHAIEMSISGDVSISSSSFSQISTSGSGSVLHSSSSGTVSVEGTSFSSCSSSGDGGVIHATVDGGTLSITDTTFTSCSSSTGNGRNLFLIHPNLDAFVTSVALNTLKPELPTSRLFTPDEKNAFVGAVSSSAASSSLLYFWHPFQSTDSDRHVHSSGLDHTHCGLLALPCSSLAHSEKLFGTTKTVVLDSSVRQTTPLVSAASEWTLAASGVFDLTLEGDGQIVVNNVASSLTLSSLSVPIADLKAGRTEELLIISAGTLSASSCTFGSTTQTMPVGLVSLTGGTAAFVSSTVRTPSTSVALFSVSGGTLTVSGSVSSMLSASPPFELSSSGAVVLDSIVTDLGNGEVSTLVSQNGGSLSIVNTDLKNGKLGKTLFCGNGNVEVKSSQFSSLVAHTESEANTRLLTLLIGAGKSVVIGEVDKSVSFTSCSSRGDGGVVHATVDGGTLSITHTTFTSCSSSGDGGVLFVSCGSATVSSDLVLQASFDADCVCGESKKGSWVFVEGHSFRTLISNTSWGSTASSLNSPADDNTLWGVDKSEAESSSHRSLTLLFFLRPYRQNTITVGDAGRDGDGCGASELKCSSLTTAASHLSGEGAHTLVIDASTTLSTELSLSTHSIEMKSGLTKATVKTTASGSISVPSQTLTLTSLIFNGESLARSGSLLSLSNTGSIAIDGCSFVGMKVSGNGGVFSSVLNTGNSLSITNSNFDGCESGGKGGALFVEVGQGTLSITQTTFTSCSSSTGNGHNLFLIHPNLDTFVNSADLNSLKPALPDSSLFTPDEKNAFVGAESTSVASSSLLYFWHPFQSTDSDRHVHSSGFDHTHCGLLALPCSSLAHSEKHFGSTKTVVLDSSARQTTPLVSAASEWTLAASGVFDLILEGDGQIEVNNVASSLTLDSLSVPIADLKAGRTVELLIISAGTLSASSCTFGSTTQAMPVGLVSLTGGTAAFVSSTVHNPSTSVALFSVSGGTLTVSGSVSSMLSASPPFELSSSGAVVLDSIVTDIGNSQVSTLVSQNGGSLSIVNTDLKNGKLGKTLFCGNGNVEVKSSQFSSLVAHTESEANTRLLTLLIGAGKSVVIGEVDKSVSFTSCSSNGDGGVVHATVNEGTLSITHTTFTSCSSSAGIGHNLFLIHQTLDSFVNSANMNSLKPALPDSGLFSAEAKNAFVGAVSTSAASSSLLYFWHPHIVSSAVFVNSLGDSNPLCGLAALPCLSIGSSLLKSNTAKTTTISSSIDLNEKIVAVVDGSTLTSTSTTNIVSVSSAGEIALSSGSLTLLSINFQQSASVASLAHSFISISSSSLVIDGCSFSSFKLTEHALIDHSESSLTLNGSSFFEIVRAEGDGAVLHSNMTSTMDLKVDAVELGSVLAADGDGDGLFVSFSEIADASSVPPFTLKRLSYSLPAQHSNSEDEICFVWIEGNNISEWVGVGDAKFAGSHGGQVEEEWLWSVDRLVGLACPLSFYLDAHTGAIGVSDSGYEMERCGYSGVWCRGLGYGLGVAERSGKTQLNIHARVTVDTVTDLNDEYRMHGKNTTAELVFGKDGGIVIDSHERVEIDVVSIVADGSAGHVAFKVVSSKLKLEEVSLERAASGTGSGSLFLEGTVIEQSGGETTLIAVTLKSGIGSTGFLLKSELGSVLISHLSLYSSISSTGTIVSASKGNLTFEHSAIPSISFTATPFIVSSFETCQLTSISTTEFGEGELFHFSEGTQLTINSCSFKGPSTSSSPTPTPNEEDEESLCTWSTGLISINDTNATIEYTNFLHIIQGALSLNNSVLTVTDSSFVRNGPIDAVFPSVHRNILCSQSEVRLESLSSGDGKDSNSLWILGSEGCVVKKESVAVETPLFVATLDSSKTTCTSTKNKTLELSVVGSEFIPCGLKLEVFESGGSGKKVEHAVSPNTVSSLNSSFFKVSLSQAELAKTLSLTPAWKGRLVFGGVGETDSFAVRMSSSDERKALTKQVMKWLIPVIAGCAALLLLLIVIVILVRRRQQKKKKEESLLNQQSQELNQQPEIKFEDDPMFLQPHSTSLIRAAPSEGLFADADKSNRTRQNEPFNSNNNMDEDVYPPAGLFEGEMGLDQKMREGGVNRKDTLYNRLHSQKKEHVAKMSVAQQVVRVLARMHKDDPTLAVFTNLSSHSVLFGKDEEIQIELVSSVSGGKSQAAQSGGRSGPVGTTSQGGHEGFELYRWRAPEDGGEPGEARKVVDTNKASVFSLGLVLFEIETGCVPFGELDAMNAHRQLKTGSLPKVELVKDESLRELIVECLEVEAARRPSLHEMEERMEKVAFSQNEGGMDMNDIVF
ncbi:hypothetical protein BLNAU_14486 [Blattamonas nauphoetae]|uniref:Protein kinase domain-containing protein n=1 Tax=Blattamonas nauphoetae TaxID=2049346 RepID=A0ABQ9XGQ6_9EUKA|nr:hypothetical protein BLNAU_14486 [Blattamonas nauphoetae]